MQPVLPSCNHSLVYPRVETNFLVLCSNLTCIQKKTNANLVKSIFKSQHKHFPMDHHDCSPNQWNLFFVSNFINVTWIFLEKWGCGSHFSCCQICIVNSELKSTLMTFFGVQSECFMSAIWYALVCKMYVCMFYEICFGVQNVCLYVPWNMLWCAKYMFVCTMKYALVCKMYVCMFYEICFGVLSWTCQHTFPEIVICSNRPNCNWKWAFVLTLYNTIARKCYACNSFVACLPSLPATFQPTHGTRCNTHTTKITLSNFTHSSDHIMSTWYAWLWYINAIFGFVH